MIDKTAVIRTVLERLNKLPVGHYLDLRTYKRDRSVIIVKLEDDNFLVVENGFYQERFEVGSRSLKGLLRTLLKKEFPRSNKVRLYSMGEYDREEVALTQRKKI